MSELGCQAPAEQRSIQYPGLQPHARTRRRNGGHAARAGRPFGQASGLCGPVRHRHQFHGKRPGFIVSKPDAQRFPPASARTAPQPLSTSLCCAAPTRHTNTLDNIFLGDIDDLQKVVDANLKERLREAQRGEEIAESEVEKLILRMKDRPDVVPTIVELQAHLEEIRKHELARVNSQFGNLSDQQREALDTLTRRMINKTSMRLYPH